MRGTRYKDKMMKKAGSGKKQRTPSNLTRILVLLRYLYNLNPANANTMSAKEEATSDQYDTLKAMVRCLRQKLYFDHPEIKGLSWHKVGGKYSSIKRRITLELEGIAFHRGINLHLWLDMWGPTDCCLRHFFAGFKAMIVTMMTQHLLRRTNLFRK